MTTLIGLLCAVVVLLLLLNVVAMKMYVAVWEELRHLRVRILHLEKKANLQPIRHFIDV